MTQSERLPRRLAAILYGDVTGYSRLTAADEDATHRRLSEYLDLFAATIERNGGRVMHYAGDAVLAKFDAVVDALSCAADIQRELAARNADLPAERRVEFGIGVNLGDVIEDRGDIYGDGVNVAARLESLAGAGEICVSDAVRVAVGQRLPFGYEDLGEQTLKNIDRPVRAYRVSVPEETWRDRLASEAPDSASRNRAGARSSAAHGSRHYFSGRRLPYALAVVLALALALAVSMQYGSRFAVGPDADGARLGQPHARASAAVPGKASPPGPRIVPLTFDGGVKDAPQLSPNGEMVAFAWNGLNRDNPDVYVKPIGRDTQAIRITDSPGFDGEPKWSPDGKELAYIHSENGQTSIYRVPALGGQAKKIVDLESPPMHGGLFVGAVAWSPDRRFLVYGEKPSPHSPARLVQLNLETLEKHELITPPSGTDVVGDFEPSFSPDGHRIAFVRGPAQVSNLDIWIMDAAGKRWQRITNEQWTTVGALGWTPDGRELLFSAGEPYVARAYSVNPEEGTPYPLPGLGEGDRGPSAGGTRLVFFRTAPRKNEIWRAPARLALDHEAPAEHLRQGAKLVFSPRGDQIAWQSDATGTAQVWIAHRDGANARALTDQKTVAFDPQWSPDARQIAFWSLDEGHADVYIVETDSGRVRRLTTDETNERHPTFSRDGRWIYFSSDRGGEFEIYKMPAEGGNAARAISGPGYAAIESYDGRHLYYESNTGIWRTAIDGDEQPLEVLAIAFRADHAWVLTADGIYYLTPGPGTDFTIHYLDFESGAVSDVYRGTGVAFYPTVSPDETSVQFSRLAPLESELWLVENFR